MIAPWSYNYNGAPYIVIGSPITLTPKLILSVQPTISIHHFNKICLYRIVELQWTRHSMQTISILARNFRPVFFHFVWINKVMMDWWQHPGQLRCVTSLSRDGFRQIIIISLLLDSDGRLTRHIVVMVLIKLQNDGVDFIFTTVQWNFDHKNFHNRVQHRPVTHRLWWPSRNEHRMKKWPVIVT